MKTCRLLERGQQTIEMTSKQQVNNPNRFVARIALAAFLAFLAILATQWFIKPSEILRTPASMGGYIVLHAVLENPNRDYYVRNGFSKTSIRQLYETGTTLVLSYRDATSDGYLDWKWFKCIEVTDRFGETIQAWNARSYEFDETRSHSGGIDSMTSYAERPGQFRFLSIHLPKIETEGFANFKVLNTEGHVVASFASPIASQVPAPEFANKVHSPASSSGDWNVRMVNTSVHFWGDAFSQRVQANFEFNFREQPTTKADVVIFDSHYSDRLGNIATDGSLPRKQPLWKYQMSVARSSKSDLFQKQELKLLGRADAAGKQTIELAKNLPIVSCVLYPAGQHEGTIAASTANYGIGWFQYGLSGFDRSGQSELNCEFHGSNGVNDFHEEMKFSRIHWGNKKVDSLVEMDTTISIQGKTKKLATDLSIKTAHPTLVIQLKQPLVDQLIHIVCLDQAQRRLSVHALRSHFPDLAFFLIEPDWDTQSIEIFSCLETLSKLEFFIAPPTANLQPPSAGQPSYGADLVPTKDGWEITDRFEYGN